MPPDTIPIGLWSSATDVSQATVTVLDITSVDYDPCPFQIQTSVVASENARGITHPNVLTSLHSHHNTNLND